MLCHIAYRVEQSEVESVSTRFSAARHGGADSGTVGRQALPPGEAGLFRKARRAVSEALNRWRGPVTAGVTDNDSGTSGSCSYSRRARAYAPEVNRLKTWMETASGSLRNAHGWDSNFYISKEDNNGSLIDLTDICVNRCRD